MCGCPSDLGHSCSPRSVPQTPGFLPVPLAAPSSELPEHPSSLGPVCWLSSRVPPFADREELSAD